MERLHSSNTLVAGTMAVKFGDGSNASRKRELEELILANRCACYMASFALLTLYIMHKTTYIYIYIICIVISC